ncbi:MAG: hypothetical protein ACK2TV_09900, partial [Anaerolineales bacterium]
KKIDIGRNKKLVLRNNNDLDKLDNFQGFQDISLVNLDLREKLNVRLIALSPPVVEIASSESSCRI